jgi:methylmalonyl-CoA epimerase
MAVKSLQYFSVATNDLEGAIKRYEESLGLKQTSEINEQRWGFRACMMGIGDQNVIELVSPVDESSALARFMKMRDGDAYPGGEGMYLVGFRVDDIDAAVAQAKAAGLTVTTDENSPNAAWVHPASNGNVMIEMTSGPPPQS